LVEARGRIKTDLLEQKHLHRKPVKGGKKKIRGTSSKKKADLTQGKPASNTEKLSGQIGGTEAANLHSKLKGHNINQGRDRRFGEGK